MNEILLENGILTHSQARFYGASLLLGVEFLQYQNIIHRDIRPESVLVDAEGYVKLTNFSCSCPLKPENRFRTYTIIGTPHYMAPEIMEKRGYSFPVDIWSVGVLLFELVCGRVPYGQDTSDPVEVFEAVQNKSLVFPAYLSSTQSSLLGRDLISKMLCKVPERRIGAENFAMIKAHEWFDNYDWVESERVSSLIILLVFGKQEGLINKKIPSPFKPNSEKLLNKKEVKMMEKNNMFTHTSLTMNLVSNREIQGGRGGGGEIKTLTKLTKMGLL